MGVAVKELCFFLRNGEPEIDDRVLDTRVGLTPHPKDHILRHLSCAPTHSRHS